MNIDGNTAALREYEAEQCRINALEDCIQSEANSLFVGFLSYDINALVEDLDNEAAEGAKLKEDGKFKDYADYEVLLQLALVGANHLVGNEFNSDLAKKLLNSAAELQAYAVAKSNNQ